MTIALKILVGITGLLSAYMAVRWMLTPEAMADALGMTLTGPAALNAARGSIGGSWLGGAMLCGLGLVANRGRYLFAAAILIGCTFAGRLIGIALDGPEAASVIAVAIEAILVAGLVGLGRIQLRA